MFFAFFSAIFCNIFLLFWNFHLLDKNEQLNLLLDDYSEQIDEDIRLFNEILKEVQIYEDDEKNNN